MLVPMLRLSKAVPVTIRARLGINSKRLQGKSGDTG